MVYLRNLQASLEQLRIHMKQNVSDCWLILHAGVEVATAQVAFAKGTDATVVMAAIPALTVQKYQEEVAQPVV